MTTQMIEFASVALIGLCFLVLTFGIWREVNALQWRARLLAKAQAALESLESNQALTGDLQNLYERLRPLLEQQQNTADTLATMSLLQQSRSNRTFWFVLMADRQNAAQTLRNCIVQSTWDADLHVLPASPMLEGAERELMGIAGAPYRLADPLSRIANRYAAIVIDTICLSLLRKSRKFLATVSHSLVWQKAGEEKEEQGTMIMTAISRWILFIPVPCPLTSSISPLT